MSEPSVQIRPVKQPPDRRLDSWKEIAAYLNRDITTVQRWEKRESLPVHRHLHSKRGTVYAFASELDDWTRSRRLPLSDNKDETGDNSNLAAALMLDEAVQIARLKRWILVSLLVASAAVAIVSFFWFQRAGRPWRNPLARARFQVITNWGGAEEAATISRDGQFIAFLSDRDEQMDVWVTQVGSGQFHNLTHGSARELVNPSIRTLGFSPDGSLVTYWSRNPVATDRAGIGVWAVPTLGGTPRRYLEDAAEYDWSSDGRQLVYHTTGAGDPILVSAGSALSVARPIFTAPAGLHSHFPLWSPDQKSVYFVHGSLPDKLDVWRISARGGVPERITEHNSQVSHPVFLDRHTLLYLATDPDSSGPWLYGMDVANRIPHRLSAGVDRYTSLAASADGRRLVATIATPKTNFWRLHIDPSGAIASGLSPITLTTTSGFRPRLGVNCLFYVSATGESESIWKLADGAAATELWRGVGAQVIGGPAISVDGRSVAFSIRQSGQSLLYLMDSEGGNSRILTGALNLQGDPAWAPDGQAIIISAVDHGSPRLFRVPLNGSPSKPLISEPSLDPAWAPDGSFVLFSGPDIGTTFSVKAAKPDGSPFALKPLALTRGARHLAFLPGGRALVVLRGDIQHKDLWLINLETGAEQRLINLPSNFHVRDFDVSSDGHEAVLEQVQDRSEVVLIEPARR